LLGGNQGMKFDQQSAGGGTRTVSVGSCTFGGSRIVLIAGPCSIESREQMLEIACAVKEAGATLLRGGAYKPRTSPYSFQGLHEKGLEILSEARAKTGLPVVTEVMEVSQLAHVSRVADMLQVGCRNMDNSVLLRALGETGKPIFLKRGMSALVEEFLLAAEYILATGNEKVVLCERGIRTFENATRFTLDLNAVPLLKQRTWLPVAVDPSHGTGRRALVTPMALAGIACGADALMVEVHNHPGRALSDGEQSLTPEDYYRLVREARAVALAVGRTID
jgi:3-deoxy-7-phosphoheptulonate synthase